MRYLLRNTTILLGCMSFFTAAASLPNVPHFYVQGTGKITVVPDTAKISFSITTRDKDLIKAKKEADTLSAKVIKIAKDYRLDKKDISASELYIQRETQYDNITRKQVFIGHKVTRSVQLYLKDLERYSHLVQSLVNAGVTEMHGVQLIASNMEALNKKASLLAIADAKQSAKDLAKGFEVNLGQLYRASKEPIQGEAPYSSRGMMEMASLKSAPANVVDGAFEAGSIDVVQHIYAVYLID